MPLQRLGRSLGYPERRYEPRSWRSSRVIETMTKLASETPILGHPSFRTLHQGGGGGLLWDRDYLSSGVSILFVIPFRGSGTRAGSDKGAVNKQVLHIWVIKEMLTQLLPDFAVAPSREPLVDTVPVAVRFWQQSPLGTTS